MPSGRRSKLLRKFARAIGRPLREVKRVHRMGRAAFLPPTPPRPRRRAWAEISAAAIERGKRERAAHA